MTNLKPTILTFALAGCTGPGMMPGARALRAKAVIGAPMAAALSWQSARGQT